MSATVHTLPTAATSFYRVRKYGSGRRWFVELVTPCAGGKPIVTSIGSTPSEAAAVEYAKQCGERAHRPVRLPGGRP
jgi:hypothetical protein